MLRFCTEEMFPIINHVLFDKILVGVFLHRFLKKFQRVGQHILQAKFSDLVEPRFGRLRRRTENVHCMAMEDVVAQPTDHSKYRELAEVKES